MGKRVRCPACATTFEPTVAEIDSNSASPTTEPANSNGDVREAPASTSEARDQSKRTAAFHVRIIHDSAQTLKGIWQASLSAQGLDLHQPTLEDFRIPVRSKAEYKSGSQFVVTMKGRAVTLSVSQLNFYQDRLARDLVEFLKGKGPVPSPSSYAIPWYLMVLALLPAGIGAVSLSGGAMGGAIGGALMGGMIGGSFAILRREKWPLVTRVAILLALNAAGYALLAWVVVAAFRNTPAQPPGNINEPATRDKAASSAPKPVMPALSSTA